MRLFHFPAWPIAVLQDEEAAPVRELLRDLGQPV
jgi:hypothetical protein